MDTYLHYICAVTVCLGQSALPRLIRFSAEAAVEESGFGQRDYFDLVRPTSGESQESSGKMMSQSERYTDHSVRLFRYKYEIFNLGAFKTF